MVIFNFMNKEPNKKNPRQANIIKYTSLGTQMLVYLGLGVWGGLKLDEKMHTQPLFLIILPITGLGISLYQLYKELSKKS